MYRLPAPCWIISSDKGRGDRCLTRPRHPAPRSSSSQRPNTEQPLHEDRVSAGPGSHGGVTPKPPAVPTDLWLRQTLSGRSLGVSAGTFQSQTARKQQRRRTSQPRYLGTETERVRAAGAAVQSTPIFRVLLLHQPPSNVLFASIQDFSSHFITEEMEAPALCLVQSAAPGLTRLLPVFLARRRKSGIAREGASRL